MKRKCVFSIAIVITLAVLSAVAFASSFYGMATDEISEQSTVSETVAIIRPETTAEPRRAVEEADPAENLQKYHTSRLLPAWIGMQMNRIFLQNWLWLKRRVKIQRGKPL